MGTAKTSEALQSLPTEMSLDSNDRMLLSTNSRTRNSSLRKERKDFHSNEEKIHKLIDGMKGDHCEIELVIANTGNQSFGIDVLCNDEGRDGLRIKVNREKNLLESGIRMVTSILNSGEPLSLRIFVDACLVEVFANEKQLVMADKKRPAGSKLKTELLFFPAIRIF